MALPPLGRGLLAHDELKSMDCRWIGRRQFEADLKDEIGFHLAMKRAYCADGDKGRFFGAPRWLWNRAATPGDSPGSIRSRRTYATPGEESEGRPGSP